METTAKSGKRPDVRVYRLAAQILEEVVVRVNAVEAGIARQGLVQIREVIVDEVRKWLRWVHARLFLLLSAAPSGALILSMVQ